MGDGDLTKPQDGLEPYLYPFFNLDARCRLDLTMYHNIMDKSALTLKEKHCYSE